MVIYTLVVLAVFFAFTALYVQATFKENERRAALMGVVLLAVMAAGIAAYIWGWSAGVLSGGLPYVLVSIVGIAMSAGPVLFFLPIGRNPKALAGTAGMREQATEQFNQKNTPFNRAHVGDYGEEISKRRWAFHALDPFAGVYWTLSMGLRPQVDGRVNPKRRDDLPVEQLTRMVKETAKYIGADLVGVTTVKKDFTYSDGFVYEKSPLAGRVSTTEPVELKHKYIIMIGREMDFHCIQSTLTDNGKSDGEIGKTYFDLARVACVLAAYIRHLGWPARAHHVRNEQVFMVPHAVDAGLGEQGRMNYLVTKQFGPRVRLAAVTTDMPLIEDKPVDIGVQDFCKICRLCETNCPAQALAAETEVVRGYRKWPQDREKCYEFWVSGGNTYACTLCLKVCPWNKPRALVHKVAFAAASRSAIARRMLYWMTVLFYGTRVRWRRLPLPVITEMPPETANFDKKAPAPAGEPPVQQGKN